MRISLPPLVVLALVLAGCTAAPATDPEADDLFADYAVEATGSTGVIRGIVIDETVRPVADAIVRVTGHEELEVVVDAQGRFAFGDLAPGTYDLTVSKLNYHDAGIQTEVRAGVVSPPLVKVQLARLWSQEPYSEVFQHRGYLECSQAGTIYSSAPCVTDFTGLLPAAVKSAAGCEPSGCVPLLREITNDDRYFVSPVANGWQQQVFELAWEATTTASSEKMGIVVSHDDRSGGHVFANVGSSNPLRFHMDVGKTYGGASADETMGPTIPTEGLATLVFFVSVRQPNQFTPAIALQQDFEVFHTKFYWGLPPEGWSLVAGDAPPF